MTKKKVLIISFSKLNNDPRVYRQIVNLKKDYEVTAAGISSPELADVEFIRISEKSRSKIRDLKRGALLKIRRYDQYYSETFEYEGVIAKAKREHFDVIIANDADSLQLAFMISDGSNILHDAHEYAPRQQEEDLYWRFFMMRYRNYLCSRYLPRCREMITVSDGIALEYANQYGIKRPEVINNATEYVEIPPSPVVDGEIRLIHHGSSHPARKIELMIEMMDHLDSRFSLDLMLIPIDKKYFDFLKQRAQGKKIRFLDPVPMNEIIRISNRYDVGVYIFKPMNFNHKFALPNKLFEFIQARLAIAIGPSIEMEKIVKFFDCGIVAPDFTPEAMAEILSTLDSERISYLKAQSSKAAKVTSSEANIVKFKEIVGRIINS